MNLNFILKHLDASCEGCFQVRDDDALPPVLGHISVADALDAADQIQRQVMDRELTQEEIDAEMAADDERRQMERDSR